MKLIRALFLLCLSILYFSTAQAGIGSFVPVPNSPFATGVNPSAIAFSPVVDGNMYAAVTNENDDTLTVYSVSLETGEFTQISNPPYPVDGAPSSVAFSSLVNGKLFVGVACYNDYYVDVFSVDLDTGLLTPVPYSRFATGGEPTGFAFSPLVNGKLYAAVSNEAGNSVSVYSVNTQNGIFTEVPNSPFDAGAGGAPSAVAFSPLINGKLFAAVSNRNGDSVSVYDVDLSTGFFTGVTGSPFTTGDSPRSVAFSPNISGKLFAATANSEDSTASIFQVDISTGVLSLIETVSDGLSIPYGIAYSPFANGFVIAAIANSDNETVSSYLVDLETGVFSLVDSPYHSGSSPRSVAFSPTFQGKLYVGVANYYSENASVYSVTIPQFPSIASVTPQKGGVKGGISVKIKGDNFDGVTSVKFGENEALSFIFITSKEINAIVPPGTGTVNVRVTTAIGISPITENDLFTYVPRPKPPRHVKGCKKIKICKGKKTAINILTWSEPKDSSAIVYYDIYKDSNLSQLVARVPAVPPFEYVDCHANKRHHGKLEYYIVSVDDVDQTSSPVKVNVKKICKKTHHDESSSEFSSSSSCSDSRIHYWKKWLRQ